MGAVRPRGLVQERRPDDPARASRAIRSATASRARCPRASAWSATCTSPTRSSTPTSATRCGTTRPTASCCGRRQQRYPTEAEKRASLEHNPEGAAVRGLWTDPEFLAASERAQPAAEAHAVRRLPRPRLDLHAPSTSATARATCSTPTTASSPSTIPSASTKAVHLQDIHLERGMHCVDCHFSQDSHGDGQIYGEYGNAIEIALPGLPRHDRGAHDAAHLRARRRRRGAPTCALGTTPFGQRRFVWRPAKGRTLFQRSMLDAGPRVGGRAGARHGHRRRSALQRAGARAKTIQRDGESFGDARVQAAAARPRRRRR